MKSCFELGRVVCSQSTAGLVELDVGFDFDCFDLALIFALALMLCCVSGAFGACSDSLWCLLVCYYVHTPLVS